MPLTRIRMTDGRNLVIRSASGGGSAKPPLTQGDITYRGTYRFDGDNYAYNLGFLQGLTHRYVGGVLRFIATTPCVEFTIPLGTYGNVVPTIVNGPIDYVALMGNYGLTNAGHTGCWLEPAASSPTGNDRLWITTSTDYPGDTQATWVRAITVRDFSNSGAISNLHGHFGLEGVGARCMFGKPGLIPQWFRTANGLGTRKYLVGHGGYASRLGINLVPSLGLMAMAIPEPTGYADSTFDSLVDLPGGVMSRYETSIPATDWKLLADHRAGNDWYASGSPTSADRGVRLAGTSPLRNYYDGGDGRPGGNHQQVTTTVNVSGTAVTDGSYSMQMWWPPYSYPVGGVTQNAPGAYVTINGTAYQVASMYDQGTLTLATSAGNLTNATLVGPTARPTLAPADYGNWLSPAPDGKARMVWGDTYNATGQWIDGPNKSGFVTIFSGASGDAYYLGSNLHQDGISYQIHCFDPADFAAVLAGTKQPFQAQPSSMRDITAEIAPTEPVDRNGSISGVMGATFDAISNTLYAYHIHIDTDTYRTAIHVYDVNC